MHIKNFQVSELKDQEKCIINVVIHVSRSFRPTLEMIMHMSLIIGTINGTITHDVRVNLAIL